MPKLKPLEPSLIAGDPVESPLVFNQEAQALYDSVSGDYHLSAAVEHQLKLVCACITVAARCEAICQAEGMTIGCGNSIKAHPAAGLAKDYRREASAGLNRLLNHLAE